MLTIRRLVAIGQAVAVAALLLCQVTTDTFAQDPRTVVEFGADGTVQGRFRQLESGTWGEFGLDGVQVFTFTETARTADSIDIEDASRGISLKLDFAEGSITFGEIGGEKQPLYEIVSAGGTIPANAAVTPEPEADQPAPAVAGDDAVASSDPEVDRVSYGENNNVQGEFVRIAPRRWSELDKDGNTTFSFDERSRSASQILLDDHSRNLALTLDLEKSVVLFGAIGEDQELLYQIVDLGLAPQAEPSVPPVDDTQAAAAEAVGDAAANAANLAALEASSKIEWPSQVRLGIESNYVGRFTVSWTDGAVPEEVAAGTWSSGEQPSPYSMALPLPASATDIRIVGEAAQPDGTWRTVLDSELSAADNRCFLMSGTDMLPSGTKSEEPSASADETCS